MRDTTLQPNHEGSKFLLDGMLGKLARWLRILGYDAAYLPDVEDSELIERVRTSGRVLLTRDKQVRRKALADNLRCVFLENTDVVAWLMTLKKELNIDLKVESTLPRCAVCNAATERVDRDSVENDVPENTYRLYSEFWRCVSCDKIYWQGSHWKQIRTTVRRVAEDDGPI